ncbi:MAG: thymidine kinase [Oscillospiraceae bacterium]|nr:thymidine kinase [Oscillospiraceae bacterium]
MAKLYFRHGTMNSGKTANMLMVAHNYLAQNKDVVILKPSKDTRWGGDQEVKSRAITDSFTAILISDTDDLKSIIERQTKKIHAILVEEAQFLSKGHVRQLAVIADEFDIPVLCYGLRCSFMDGEMFEGSVALMYWADSIEEIKTVCEYCHSKATKNLLRIDGIAQYAGETNVVMGDVNGSDVKFTPVCRKHYLNPPS